jgi:predicted nicotinamide N-methyase
LIRDAGPPTDFNLRVAALSFRGNAIEIEMNLPVDIRKEINPALDVCTSPAFDGSGLPELPCGWVLRDYQIGDRELQLIVPSKPDELLDDPAVRAANDSDDYMPYWAYLWPSAIPMANAVLKSRWPAGTHVLELGCGVGLVGIAALAAGYRVDLTDYDVTSVAAARRNAEINGFSSFDAYQLDWRTPPVAKFPVVLGCDLTYEQRNHAPILNLLESVLEPDGCCWLADGGRTVSEQFWNLAVSRGFTVTIRDAEFNEIPRPGIHYQLFELRRR